jgi:hypothetical protein
LSVFELRQRGINLMTDSMFIAGYQLGCQIDVSSGVQLGGAAALAPSASLGIGSGPGVNAGVGGHRSDIGASASTSSDQFATYGDPIQT